ncbi:MAG: HNH endonuclease signature motif containing protein [Nitrososphaeraceae archaeon]|nr:HNH endonuclease signature motif containing protein [Nitrososphaeraceae archaeon]
MIGSIIWKITHRTKERRYFPANIKRQILKDQKYKCAICKQNTEVWDYDHKNGDRSNNKLSNCQALCPNCHAKKTRGLLNSTKKSNQRSLKFFIIFMIMIFLVFIYFSYG